MAYKRISPQPVVEGGTGRSTLTNHGLLIGAGTTGITQSSVGATGTVLIGNSAADPTFTATPVVTSINFGGSTLSTYTASTSFTHRIRRRAALAWWSFALLRCRRTPR